MNDKLKFYRSTLVQMTKGLIGYTPMHKLAEDADKVTKEIMQKVDEYEFKERPSIKDCVTSTTITCTDPNFFKDVNPDYLKTEPMRTIVDNGPQYQPNQKSYGTLGEHWKELSYLFDFKKSHSYYKNALKNFIRKYKTKDFNPFEKDDHSFSFITEHETKCLIDIANSLGIEFIEDFIKACEKCEE